MKKEIPQLQKQDVGGAELPYLFYDGGPRQILLLMPPDFCPGCGIPSLKILFRNIRHGRRTSATTDRAIRMKEGWPGAWSLKIWPLSVVSRKLRTT